MITAVQASIPDTSVRTICRVLGISRSWYSAARVRRHDAVDEALITQIEAIVLRHPGYGYRRVTTALQRAGIRINHKRVVRLMRDHALLYQVKRAVRTTFSSHGFLRQPNLLRGSPLTGPGQAWVADLTYLVCAQERGFLACVLDAWSRRCLGWALSGSLDATVALDALETAIRIQPPRPGLIHHSDQGIHYANNRYAARLAQIGARQSMSAVGTPTDNARMEAFFSTLKREEVRITGYQTLADARIHLERYIDQIYNTERLHSSLGYRTPAEAEFAS